MWGSDFTQWRLRRGLVALHRELVAARESISVLTEQLASFAEDADEAEVRSMVSENTADQRVSREATGHREIMERALERARARVEALSRRELELLDRIEG